MQDTLSPKITLMLAFINGVLFTFVMIGLAQDYLGRKQYIAYVIAHWVSLPWEPWIVLYLMVVWFQIILVHKVGAVWIQQSICKKIS